MNVEIVKARVDAKSRKLKVTWTVEPHENLSIWHNNELTTVDSKAACYSFGVNCEDAMFSRRRNIQQWVCDTFDEQDYLFSGKGKELVWFAKEKHRTLLLMKWS